MKPARPSTPEEQEREALRYEKSLLLESSRYFIKKILSYRIESHHENILQHIIDHRQSLDLAPRGSGKSRIITIGYTTWKALRDPNIRILIVSDTDTHATRFLNTGKTALRYHPLIKKHFGDLTGPKWTEHEVELTNRTKILTEATMTALGAYSGAVTSGHYDIIICDDLVNFENGRTEGSRARMLEWYKQTLLPTLIPGGELHVLGTRYHFLDLYQTMIDEMGYDTQVQQAIQYDEEGQERSIWEDYMPLTDRPGRSGKIIDGLTTIREKAGSVIFNLQYQNDVELMKRGDIFHYDWFRWYTTETREDGITYLLRDDGIEIPTTHLEIYGGLDPAVGEHDRNDYFAICMVGLDRPAQEAYVLDIYKARLSYDQRARIVDGKFQQWHPRIFGIEDVGFQKEFVQRIRKTYPYIRVKEIKTDKDKVSRAYARSGLVENGRIFVKRGMHEFVEELCIMPDGAHDDQFDAWDFAMQASAAAQSGMKKTSLPGAKKYRVQTIFKEQTMAQKLYR